MSKPIEDIEEIEDIYQDVLKVQVGSVCGPGAGRKVFITCTEICKPESTSLAFDADGIDKIIAALQEAKKTL